ncbi:MAG: amino acid permease, partial [Varibaculum cambriense]|nr:amino acid permease [Varibaculum cambriense]
FYVGCIALFTLLLPHNVYNKNESPFVTFFTAIGIPAAGTIMNIVVMLAAASAINAELYTCGRGLRSLAVSGSAPRFLAGMNRNAVPYAAIVAAGTVGMVGVIINMIHPSEAFDVIAYMAGIGICSMWGSVMISNILFVRYCRRTGLERPKFHVPWAPYTNYVVLAVFASMIVLMWFEGGLGPAAIIAFASVTVVLALAWLVVRNHVDHDMFTAYAPAETEASDSQ